MTSSLVSSALSGLKLNLNIALNSKF
jgi:hypothetical protein